jgi:hypothetical protein
VDRDISVYGMFLSVKAPLVRWQCGHSVREKMVMRPGVRSEFKIEGEFERYRMLMLYSAPSKACLPMMFNDYLIFRIVYDDGE